MQAYYEHNMEEKGLPLQGGSITIWEETSPR